MMSRQRFKAKNTLKALTLAFPNWYITDSTYLETGAGAAATITASIEYPAGAFTQVKFSGSASGSIADGATLLSDVVSVDMPDGAIFWVRTYLTCTAGIVYSAAAGETSPGISGSEIGVSGITDKTMGGAIGDSTGVYAPIVILGTAIQPSIAIHGDSRAFGSGDSEDGSQDSGNLQRTLSDRFVIVNLSKSGDRAAKLANGYTKRNAVADYCTHVIVQTGTNDIRSDGRTAAQVRADNETVAALYPTKTVFGATVEPISTSTDSWATIANQTPTGNNSERIAYNNLVRAGLTGFAGFFDLADVAESSRDSGKWKVTGSAFGYTVDGVHPCRAGYLLVPESGAIDFRWFLPDGSPPLKFASLKQAQQGMASNLLMSPKTVFGDDDTFTPVIVGTASPGVGTYSAASGYYRRIGNLVFVQMLLNWTAHTGTGNLAIEGLPFQHNSGKVNDTVPFAVNASNLTFTPGSMLVAATSAAGGTGRRVNLLQVTSGAALAGVPMDTSAFITLTGWYVTGDQ